MKYLILAGLWILFCVIHSWMISIPVTKYLKQKLGHRYRYYRIFYNIISLCILIPIMLYSRSLNEKPFFEWNGNLVYIKYFLLVLSVLLFMMGARQYSLSSFLGFAQLKEKDQNNLISSSGKLDSGGILDLVRHPFYTAVFPLLWAGDLSYTNLIINIILSIYLIIGTILEEQKLILEFGDEYKDYQKKVSMFIPVKWIKKMVRNP